MSRRNCALCGRWRHASDYGAAESAREENGPVCAPCRRTDPAHEPRVAERARIYELAVARETARVERGESVWLTPAFRAWLRAAADRYGWWLMAEWAGITERNVRHWLHPDQLSAGIDAVDRLLIWEGSGVRLDDFWPLPEAA